ncbi:hypothetical protein CRENBAI_026265 [Crenichthys baileyi]|uniref:Uncharacterized protein n=1 Tax=Crenichthys baileyi TaxID=28760 RepID=A0AAV9S2L1_9TELE
MLPARLHSGVLRCTNFNRMFPLNMDLADSRQESARDRWVQQQMEEAIKHLLANREVLPSPLLLEQMEREAVQRPSPPSSLVARPNKAVKSTSSCRCKKRRRGAPSCVSASEEEFLTAAAETSGAVISLSAGGRVAASIPTSSSATAQSPRLAAARPCRLRSLHPELMEKIMQMERDYETAVRQFYCRPPPSSPGLQSSATAEQPTPGLQGAAATEQPTPGVQGAAATEQPMPGLQGAAAEQTKPGLQPAADFPGGSEDGPPLLPVSEGSEGGLPLILALGLSDCVPGRTDPQPDTPQPDTPQPDTLQPGMKSDSKPDPKSASTSSTRRRGRRKRGASAEVIGGPGDASASAHTTEGPGDASASAHATEGLGDASSPMASERGGVRQVFSITLIISRGGFKEETASNSLPECCPLVVYLNLTSLSAFESLGLLSSGKKSFHLMHKDSNLHLLLWISPAGSFLYTWEPPQ